MTRGRGKRYRTKKRGGNRPTMKEKLIQVVMEQVPDYQFLSDQDKYIVNCASHFHLRLECYLHDGDKNYQAETHGLFIREYYEKDIVEEFLNSESELEFQKKITNEIKK